MTVRPKKYLGQHFLTDLQIARNIVASLQCSSCKEVLEVGPGMGVLTQYLLEREDLDLKVIEIDSESVIYLREHFPTIVKSLYEADFLKTDLRQLFAGNFCIIGNFPYNISSQIFFKILEIKDFVPEIVCMIQKEVAERIASPHGSKVYGILSVLIQTWYDIEYLFTVGEGAFLPPPKVKSAVIRLTRNSRKNLPCDEQLFRQIVKAAFNQRRKTIRNSLKGLSASMGNIYIPERFAQLRPEQISVEDFIALATESTKSF